MSPVKFAHLAEKLGKGSISNLSNKLRARDRGASSDPPGELPHAPRVHVGELGAAEGRRARDNGRVDARALNGGRVNLIWPITCKLDLDVKQCHVNSLVYM